MKLNKNDDVIYNSKVWPHNNHFHVKTAKEVESLHCFFVLDGLSKKLVRGSFRLLISDLNSKPSISWKS